jgi:bifunctional DNA-binding transcriptional regulator/antitoxin component of YhaV-PrlF toxin-antitoxin module
MTTVVVQEDENGELYIELPPEILDNLGWNNYDNLEWVIEDDGKIILRKRETDDSSNET